MRDRTADLLRAKQALSQLSYSPSITGLFAPLLRCTCRSLSCVPDVRAFACSGVRLVEPQKSCVLDLLISNNGVTTVSLFVCMGQFCVNQGGL